MSKPAEQFVDPAFMDHNSPEFEAAANPAFGEEPPDPAPADPEQGEIGATPGAEAGTEQGPGNEAPAEPAPDADPEAGQEGDRPIGIQSKHSDRIIPYEQLEHERIQSREAREAQQRAEQERDQLRSELESMRGQMQNSSGAVDGGGDAGGDQPGNADITALLDKADSFKEDFPELAEVLGPLVTAVSSLQKENSELTGYVNSERQTRENQQRSEARVAMDENPWISTWETSDPASFDLVYHADQALMKDPAWADKPIAERFQHAVERVLAIRPDAKAPAQELIDAYRGNAAPSQQESDDPADVEARAAEALKNASGGEPGTLTGIPGGGVAQEDNRLDNMSPIALEAMVDGMNPEQFDDWVNKVA